MEFLHVLVWISKTKFRLCMQHCYTKTIWMCIQDCASAHTEEADIPLKVLEELCYKLQDELVSKQAVIIFPLSFRYTSSFSLIRSIHKANTNKVRLLAAAMILASCAYGYASYQFEASTASHARRRSRAKLILRTLMGGFVGSDLKSNKSIRRTSTSILEWFSEAQGDGMIYCMTTYILLAGFAVVQLDV